VGAYTLGAGFGGAPTQFAVKENRVLSRNLDQNMHKNELVFRKKKLKIAEA